MAEVYIKLDEICEMNINLIIGSGASYGLFPTLSIGMLKGKTQHTIETIATEIEQTDSKVKPRILALLFMYYYETCIKPISKLDLAKLSEPEQEVIENYSKLLNTLLVVLRKKQSSNKRCNLFTTNYDGCIPFAADKILKKGQTEFVINDGTRGFRTKYLQARYFNSYLRQTGVFGDKHHDLSQINLINLHGSAYWSKENESIVVNYNKPIDSEIEIDEKVLSEFSELLNSAATTFEVLEHYANKMKPNFDEKVSNFFKKYNSLPIVNPTKWKFHETVFEEHYYQMLRAMSYELEKPNSIFITFGFSFADEHILNLVKRSLSNPSLQLFVCCFNAQELEIMEQKFIGHDNVQYITSDNGNLDFKTFNEITFSLNPQPVPELE